MQGVATDVLPGLSPIQRAYLVGDQEGLELRGPARYYVPCDLDPALVPGLDDRLRVLARYHPILRADVGPDLGLTVQPPTPAARLAVDVRRSTDEGFPDANDAVRREFTDDAFDFGARLQLRLTVVCSPRRARLHLIYALWMLDAPALDAFLAALVAPVPPQAPPDTPDPPRRDRTERDERYWRDRAAALPGPAELPLRPDWRQAGRRVGHRTVTLEPAAGQRIARTAARRGLTPAAVYLAAYGTVLAWFGGGAAHTVTVLHSLRPADAADARIGNLGTTMPVEIPAPDASSFAELAHAVQARSLGHAMHSSLSGAQIIRLADPVGAVGRLPHPFAFTAFTTDTRAEAARGLRRRWDEVQLRVPQVLMDHQAALDADGTVRLGFDWRTDAFDPGFAEDFVECCARMVLGLAQIPESWDAPSAAAPAAPAALRSAPSPKATPHRAEPASHGTGLTELLHERVLRTAATHPDRPAVHDDDGTLTYSELVVRAAAAAGLLHRVGARSGDRVAVHLPRGAGQAVAELGILMAGCVFVPVDLVTPPGRLDALARRAAIRFAFTTPPRQPAWPESESESESQTTSDPAQGWGRRGARPLTLPDPESAAADAAPGLDSGAAQSPACPTAYVIFTSGSTGEPKGVVISHAAVLATLDAVNAEFGVGPGDSVLSVSSIGFDLSVYDVFGPLLRGGSVVMLSEDSGRSPAAWVERIRRFGVTLWNSAPALAALLADEGAAISSIRAFLLSGDWIALTLPARLRRLAPAAGVVSLGGATEGSIWSIFHRIGAADCEGRSIPYGRPLAGQDVLVLDAALRPCPDWHIGGLYIAGAGVADCYENDPERTAAAFLRHPVYGRIYRTGDRGRRLPGGVIEFLGRTDTQVKLNGHRVELGEIEHVLSGAVGVRRCAAAVREAGRGARVIAFVSLAPDAPAHWRDAARAALADLLPSYMVPDAIVELDELPLGASGKLDRRRLAALPLPADLGVGAGAPYGDGSPGPDSALDDSAHEDPGAGSADPYSHEVAACWKAVLGRPPGRRGFFEDGGSSYDAIRLLSLLRSSYGHEVPYGRFAAEPTAAGLVRRCRERARASSGIWVLTPRPTAAPSLRVVLFPPVGGAVSCYAELVRQLGDDTGVHLVGFDGPAFDGAAFDGAAFAETAETAGAAGTAGTAGTAGANAAADVPAAAGTASPTPALADLARQCLGELPAQALADDAPLVFAGWSFGGALAFEAARLCPVPVARVVVIDTPAPGAADDRSAAEPTLDGFLDDIRRTGGAGFDPDRALADPALAARFAVYRQNMRLLGTWDPQPSDIPLTHLRAADAPVANVAAHWSRIAPVASSAVLAGGHFDVFAGANARAVVRALEGQDG